MINVLVSVFFCILIIVFVFAAKLAANTKTMINMDKNTLINMAKDTSVRSPVYSTQCEAHRSLQKLW